MDTIQSNNTQDGSSLLLPPKQYEGQTILLVNPMLAHFLAPGNGKTKTLSESGKLQAILLQQIYYWQKWYEKRHKETGEYTDHLHRGLYWFYNTADQWEINLGYLFGNSCIRAALVELERKDLIMTAKLNQKGYDQKKWYRVNEPRFFGKVVPKMLKAWDRFLATKASETKEKAEKRNEARIIKKYGSFQIDTLSHGEYEAFGPAVTGASAQQTNSIDNLQRQHTNNATNGEATASRLSSTKDEFSFGGNAADSDSGRDIQRISPNQQNPNPKRLASEYLKYYQANLETLSKIDDCTLEEIQEYLSEIAECDEKKQTAYKNPKALVKRVVNFINYKKKDRKVFASEGAVDDYNYFLQRYKEEYGREHPEVNPGAMREIVDWLEENDDVEEKIDVYFSTQHGGNFTEHNLVHFIQMESNQWVNC